jgi:HSP20 family protein
MNLKSLVPIGRHHTKVAAHDGNPFTFLQREIDRLFENFSRDFSISRSSELMPSMDVTETDKEIELSVELPGLDAKDVEINLADDVLTIRGEKRAEKEEKDKNYRLIERSYGSFTRSIELPAGVKAESIKANFANGVLKVMVPKPAPANVQKIDVKAAA